MEGSLTMKARHFLSLVLGAGWLLAAPPALAHGPATDDDGTMAMHHQGGGHHMGAGSHHGQGSMMPPWMAPGYGFPKIPPGHSGMMRGPGHPGMMRGPGHGCGSGWGMRHGRAMADQDGDGLVLAEEAAARAEATFAYRDQNGDNKLSSDEFQGRSWGPWHYHGRHREGRFKRLDENDNGSVDRAEFFAAHEADYEAADGDGDGKVTVWEFRAAPKR
jgi:hypothetical protein